jgi:hypothetical protein
MHKLIMHEPCKMKGFQTILVYDIQNYQNLMPYLLLKKKNLGLMRSTLHIALWNIVSIATKLSYN